jgi:O-methyltransferase
MSTPRNIVYSSKHKTEVYDPPLQDIDRDPLFTEIFDVARHYTMTSKERMYTLYQSCRYIISSKLRGDYVECGVWRGGSSILAALTFEKLLGVNHGRKFYLYDTFEGMAPPTDKDVDLHGKKAAEYMQQFGDDGKWVYAGDEEVVENFKKSGVKNIEAIVIAKGMVEQTIPRIAPKKISILRLDTDWYESTKHELIHLWPRLTPEGICIIDDYGYWKGSQEATDEYFRDEPRLFLHRIDGESRLIVKPPKRSLFSIT